MPRQRRKESNTGLYHVIAKGINKEMIFNQSREKSYLKRIIKELLTEHNIEIYAYCIMSNHVHLIIKSELQELSTFMAKCLAKYAEYYNYKHKRNGHVFQNRFRSECIENEKYFWNCIRYIHLNPVKANQIKDVKKYRYSSIMEYKSKTEGMLCEKAKLLYSKKFDNWAEFIDFHNEKQRYVITDVKEDMYKQKKEIALFYLEEMQQDQEIERIERILEERELRKKYCEMLLEKMEISTYERDRIVNDIKKKYIR